jgi:hypothetical protein
MGFKALGFLLGRSRSYTLLINHDMIIPKSLIFPILERDIFLPPNQVFFNFFHDIICINKHTNTNISLLYPILLASLTSVLPPLLYVRSEKINP